MGPPGILGILGPAWNRDETLGSFRNPVGPCWASLNAEGPARGVFRHECSSDRDTFGHRGPTFAQEISDIEAEDLSFRLVIGTKN